MNISDAVIKRIPCYFRYLNILEKNGVSHISSYNLGKIMGLTPSQVRQDINCFGGMGRQGYGYLVVELKQHIANIIGMNKTHKMIIIGAGNIGNAIAGYKSFVENGYITSAVFDISKNKVGKVINGVPVYDIADIENYIKSNDINISVLACPADVAQGIADSIIEYGVKAIWNFAPIDLKLPKNVVCVDVSLSESLQQLSFRLNRIDADE